MDHFLKINKQLVVHLLLMLLITFIWIECTSMIQSSSRVLRWVLAGVLALAMVVVRRYRKKITDVEFRHFMTILTTAFVLVFAISLWNNVFRAYYHGSDFERDIFRGAFANLRAPLYTTVHLSIGKLSHYAFILLLPLSYLLFFSFNFKRWNTSFIYFSASYLALAIICYGLTDGWYERVLDNNVHYLSFLNDSQQFTSISNMLHTYVDRLQDLSRSSHYPPGNVTLFLLEKITFPYFVKLFVASSTVLSILPMTLIMRSLKMDTQSINLSVGLYVFSTSIPSFPTFSLSPITILFSLYMIYFTIKFIESGALKYSIYCALSTVIFMFFSYAFTLIGLLMFCFILLSRYYHRLTFKSIFTFCGLFLFVIIASYWLLYEVSGFNQLECLLHSVENNSNSMSGGFDSVKRYLLRSSGNIIAYLAGVGIPIVAYSFYALNKSVRGKGKSITDALITGTFSAIFIAGFCGLFFLETARIWILFTPFLCIAAGNALVQFPFDRSRIILLTTLALTLMISISEELFVDHSYKYFSTGW